MAVQATSPIHPMASVLNTSFRVDKLLAFEEDFARS
jgi:hypothetical protein